MNDLTRLVIRTAAAALIVSTAIADADFEINWHTIDGGGQMSSTGGDFELGGTVGQPDADVLIVTGSEFRLTGGFWPVVTVGVPIPGDCDSDGDVDLDDFANFPPCLLGPAGGLGAGCGCVDLDSDGDTDLLDFASFHAAFTGPLP